MGSKPPAPTPPRETSAATTASNVSTALANAWMQNMDESGPFGSRTVTQSGTVAVTDPYTGHTYQVPRFSVRTALSPQQQAIANEQQRADLNLARLGANQADRLGRLLGRDFDLSGAPEVRTANLRALPETDFSADRRRVENALFGRLESRLAQDEEALRTRLANQGIGIGTEAYTRAMKDFGSNRNDARLAAILGAGQEQSRLAADRLAEFQAANAGMLQQADADAAARARFVQEQAAVRSQPINEIASLLGGSQVTMPQFYGQVGAGGVPFTDNAAIIANSDAARQNAWAQRQASLGSLLSGLGGIGGLFALSDRRAKEDVRRIGKTSDGLSLYRYRYKGDPEVRIGLMAQEVAKKKPHAVAVRGDGLMAVNYAEALK